MTDESRPERPDQTGVSSETALLIINAVLREQIYAVGDLVRTLNESWNQGDERMESLVDAFNGWLKRCDPRK